MRDYAGGDIDREILFLKNIGTCLRFDMEDREKNLLSMKVREEMKK